MDKALREVRLALLEADVSLSVVKDFIKRVKEKAIGAEVHKALRPGQMVVKIVADELVETLGEPGKMELNGQSPHGVVCFTRRSFRSASAPRGSCSVRFSVRYSSTALA